MGAEVDETDEEEALNSLRSVDDETEQPASAVNVPIRFFFHDTNGTNFAAQRVSERQIFTNRSISMLVAFAWTFAHVYQQNIPPARAHQIQY